MKRRSDSERGSILAIAGACLVAFLAIGAIAIGVSRLTDTATEVQAVADSGALAGGSALLRGGNAYAEAKNVAQVNRIDGKAGNFDASLPTPDNTNNADPNGRLVTGYYDPATHQLVVGGVHPDDAVQATEYASVGTLWASILTPATSTALVTKQAIAGYAPLSSNRDSPFPTLPVALGDCFFTSFQQGNQCALLPIALSQVPNTANTGWTSLTGAQGNSSNTEPYFPAACGVKLSGGQGGIQTTPDVTAGESLGVINGQTDPLIKDVCDCVNNGLTQWVIPIVHCPAGNSQNFSNLNQSLTTVGFASITINYVCTGTNSPPCAGVLTPPQTQCTDKSIGLSVFCSYPNIPGPPTPDNFGSGHVALLQ